MTPTELRELLRFHIRDYDRDIADQRIPERMRVYLEGRRDEAHAILKRLVETPRKERSA